MSAVLQPRVAGRSAVAQSLPARHHMPPEEQRSAWDTGALERRDLA